MNDGQKVLLACGLAGAGYLGFKMYNLNRLNNELETVTRIYVQQVSLTGITLRLDITLKNPSGAAIKVKFPFVKIYYGTSQLATSEVRNEDLQLPKYSQIDLPPIMVQLNLVTLALQVPAAVKAFRSDGAVALTVKTISTLNNTFPYTRTDTINLFNKQDGSAAAEKA